MSHLPQISSSANSNIALLRPVPVLANPFTFPGGDVTIKVTFEGATMTGKVVSQAMMLASPVWKCFIHPPWAPPGSAPITQLDFTEDHGDEGRALLFLLKIVHLQFAGLPTVFSIDLLYEIAQLCEQYDCTQIALPFLTIPDCPNTNYLPAVVDVQDWRVSEKVIYIAWAFGKVDIFRRLAKDIIREISLTVEENQTELKLPDKLLESILEKRKECVKKILRVPNHHIGRLQNYKKPVCVHGSKACDTEALKSLLRQLKKLEIRADPLDEAINTKQSMSFLLEQLSKIKIHGLVFTDSAGKYRVHDACGSNSEAINYVNEMQKIMREVDDPSLDCHIRHMQMRRGLTVVDESFVKREVCAGSGERHNPACGELADSKDEWDFDECMESFWAEFDSYDS